MAVINIKLEISSYSSVYLNVQFWSYTILRNFPITLYNQGHARGGGTIALGLIGNLLSSQLPKYSSVRLLVL